MMQRAPLSSGSTTETSISTDGVPPFAHHPATGVNMTDTQAGAETLARRVVLAWASGGHVVDAWAIKLAGISQYSERGEKALWGVRTDLVNGMPSGLGRAKWERKYGQGI